MKARYCKRTIRRRTETPRKPQWKFKYRNIRIIKNKMIKHENFIKIAEEIASASKCVSMWVWAVIVKNNRILSMWYNGTPAGYVNCNDHWKWEYTKDHHDWSAQYEIHAEMNAVLYAAKTWVNIDWSVLYTTVEPCFNCTKNIVACGIKEVYYKEHNRHDTKRAGKEFLEQNWIKSYQV